MEKDQTIKIDLLEDSHYFKTNQVIALPPQSKSCMIRAGTTRTVLHSLVNVQSELTSVVSTQHVSLNKCSLAR